MDINLIIAALGPFSIIGVCLLWMDEVLERRWSPAFTVLAWIIIAGGNFGFSRVEVLTHYMGLIPVVGLPLTAAVLYKGKTVWHRLGFGLLLMVFIILMDIVMFALYTVFGGRAPAMDGARRASYGISSIILVIILYRPVGQIYGRIGKIQRNWYTNIFLIMVFLMEYIPLLIQDQSYRIMESKQIIFNIFYLTVLIVFDIGLVYFFNWLDRTNARRQEMALLLQQTDMQQTYYTKIDEQYTHSRVLVHDIKNHMDTLSQLYTQDPEAGHVYAMQVLDSIEEVTDDTIRTHLS